jgi:hypothetical protein
MTEEIDNILVASCYNLLVRWKGLKLTHTTEGFELGKERGEEERRGGEEGRRRGEGRRGRGDEGRGGKWEHTHGHTTYAWNNQQAMCMSKQLGDGCMSK